MSTSVWSDLAREDLKQIGRYIGREQHRPATAVKIMRELRDCCEELADAPRMGTARPDLGTEIRITAYKRWVIIFRPRTYGVDVLRIVDGSRDWSKLF